jgi:hypothetical protein
MAELQLVHDKRPELQVRYFAQILEDIRPSTQAVMHACLDAPALALRFTEQFAKEGPPTSATTPLDPANGQR